MKIKGSLTRSVVIGAVAALTALAGLAFAPGAGAAANYTQTRFAGTDRFDTAALISAAIAEATPTAVIARADIYPDALTGAFAAAANGDGPLMLTRSDSVPQRTIDSLKTEGVTSVVLLGGTTAISTAAENQLRTEGFTVRRIAGANRYETAAAIARDGAAIIGTIDGKRTAILSSGENFPDALSGAPMSFAVGLPSLLTGPTSLHPAALSALQSLNITQVLILGGTAAVAQSVEDDLRTRGFSPVRLAGANRSGTSVEVFEFGLDKGVYTNRRFGLARGDTFPDALAYAPLAGRPRTTVAPDGGAADTVNPTFNANGLLLAAASCTLSVEVENFIEANASTWSRGEILGGDQALCPAVADQVLDSAKFGDVNITLSPASGASGASTTATYTGGRPANITNVSSPNCTIGSQGSQTNGRTFTVSGTPGTACTINTTVTFTDTSGGTQTLTDTFTLTGGGTTPPPGDTGQGVSSGPQLATSGPDLLSVAIVGDGAPGGALNQVRYTFDAPVQTVDNSDPDGAGASTSRYSLQGFNSGTRQDNSGTNANAVIEGGGTSVLVTFPNTIDLRQFTIGTTDAGAAVNPSGTSVLASKALQGSSIGSATGVTDAPVLTSVEAVSDATRQITYVFDKPLSGTPADTVPGQFFYYDANSNQVAGNTAVVQSGANNNKVTVTFLAPAVPSQAVRYAAGDPSATNTDGDDTSAVESEVTKDDNALSHVGTVTTAPDLTAVARVPGSPNKIDFTFDRDVTAANATLFAVYNVNGDRISGNNSESTGNLAVVRVTFPGVIEDNAGQFSRAGAEQQAATASAAPAQASTIGGFALPATGTAAAGLTSGPDLISAVFPSGSNEVRYTFDEDLLTTSAVPGAFFVVSPGGAAAFSAGPATVVGRTVTVSFTGAQLAGAVGAGVTSVTGTQNPPAAGINGISDADGGADPNSPDSVGRS